MTDNPSRIAPKDVEAACRGLIHASESNLGVEVAMPLIYPSGNGVTVIVADEGATYLVHDAGFGSMELEASGVRLSEKIRNILSQQAKSFGCEYTNSRMWLRCSKDKLPVAIALVANASKLVGDKTSEQKNALTTDFRKEVVNLLEKHLGNERLRIDAGVPGEMGIDYRMKIVVLDKSKQSAQAFIETIQEQKSVNAPFRAFYDIRKNESLANVSRLSIYDDRNHWRAADLLLLQDVSSIIPYTTAQAHIDRVLQ